MPDARGVKRPRSTTPTKGDATPAANKKRKDKKGSSSTKKSKKNKKNKSGDKGSPSETKNQQQTKASALDSTATAQGQMMAQMLSTFSKVEQSRFEAFRRATIPNQAVQEWLAACLVHRYRHNGSVVGDLGHGEPEKPPPKLSDLVEPGSATSIGIVASTLAKVYAQRLVSAAQAVAVAEEQQQEGAVWSSDGAQQHHGTAFPLQPHHIMTALTSRQQQGLDPGFFLQPQQANATILQQDNYDQRRLAALAAQEAYDKYVGRRADAQEDAPREDGESQLSSEAKTEMDTS